MTCCENVLFLITMCRLFGLLYILNHYGGKSKHLCTHLLDEKLLTHVRAEFTYNTPVLVSAGSYL